MAPLRRGDFRAGAGDHAGGVVARSDGRGCRLFCRQRRPPPCVGPRAAGRDAAHLQRRAAHAAVDGVRLRDALQLGGDAGGHAGGRDRAGPARVHPWTEEAYHYTRRSTAPDELHHPGSGRHQDDSAVGAAAVAHADSAGCRPTGPPQLWHDVAHGLGGARPRPGVPPPHGRPPCHRPGRHGVGSPWQGKGAQTPTGCGGGAGSQRGRRRWHGGRLGGLAWGRRAQGQLTVARRQPPDIRRGWAEHYATWRVGHPALRVAVQAAAADHQGDRHPLFRAAQLHAGARRPGAARRHRASGRAGAGQPGRVDAEDLTHAWMRHCQHGHDSV
mmetsp:Transcript_7898/g.23814  ORF Transcript_7898/g.23814 Transcript_7898/m.23814 type:complete len:328 (+) Transcript_7898:400-1383(+)